MKRNYLLLTLSALVSTAALAQTSTVPEGKKDRRDPDYVRCRSIEVTGSLVKKDRVCRTNREWEALRTRGNSDAERFIEQSRTGTNAAG